MGNPTQDGWARNGVLSLGRSSLPLTWLDSQAPAFAVAPLGVQAPATSTFVGTAPNELVLQAYNPATNDRAFGTIQFNHDLEIPAGGTVTFSPHVHWTCSTIPTTNTFLAWRLCYTTAKPGISFLTAGRFDSTVATSTGRTTVPASTAGLTAHRHLLTELQDFTVPSSSVGASHILILSVSPSSASTLDVSPLLLGVDVHYQARAGGTVAIYE